MTNIQKPSNKVDMQLLDDFDDDKFEAALKNKHFTEEDLLSPPMFEDFDDDEEDF